MTVEEALEQLHTEIDRLNLAPMSHGVYDDEDLIVYALNFLGANLEHGEIFELPEEEDAR